MTPDEYKAHFTLLFQEQRPLKEPDLTLINRLIDEAVAASVPPEPETAKAKAPEPDVVVTKVKGKHY